MISRQQETINMVKEFYNLKEDGSLVYFLACELTNLMDQVEQYKKYEESRFDHYLDFRNTRYKKTKGHLTQDDL